MAAYCWGDLKSHRGLTACTLGSALDPTLINEYGRTLFFIYELKCSQQPLLAVVSSADDTAVNSLMLYIITLMAENLPFFY